MNEQASSPACDCCGYAVGVRRVTILVQDQPARFKQLCPGCLVNLLELVRPPVGRRAAV